jgi:uncharacterized protein (TIGR02147 family)
MEVKGARRLKKSIYLYGNFREFLNDFYLGAKEENPKFGFKIFAQMAGFKSPSFLKLVMQGKRNLATPSIESISLALKLNREEAFFFRNLVLMNQAHGTEEKQSFAAQLIRSREYKKLHPLSQAQYSFLSQWYLAAIHELVSLPHFKEDPDWIGNHLSPKITAKQAETAVEELLKLGLLIRNESGKLERSETNITTPDEVVSSYAVHFHKEMLKKAAESIDNIPRDRREITTVTFSMSERKIAEIKEIIHRCRKEILECTTTDPESDAVFQLNFQLFPLGDSRSEGEDGGS